MRLFLGLALVLSSITARVMAGTPAQAPSMVAAESAAPPLSVWRLDTSLAGEHLQSGLKCPTKMGDYTRTNLTVFDHLGLDVSCNYAAAHRDITLYLTRRTTTTLDAAMAEAQSELLQLGSARHPSLISQPTGEDQGLTWTGKIYAEDAGVHSLIWMADLHGWTLEYRATYPATQEASITPEISAMNAQVLVSAGHKLGQCAKASAPQRTGRRITDRKTLESASLLAALLGSTAEAMARDKPTIVVASDSVWCVENRMETDAGPAIYWREVNADGSDGGSDKVTGFSDTPPPYLEVTADELASVMREGKTKHGQWNATLIDGEQSWIFAHFDGRPSPQTLSGLWSDIQTGKATSLIGFKLEGKNTTIQMPSPK